jgi:hypothetical protein
VSTLPARELHPRPPLEPHGEAGATSAIRSARPTSR